MIENQKVISYRCNFSKEIGIPYVILEVVDTGREYIGVAFTICKAIGKKNCYELIDQYQITKSSHRDSGSIDSYIECCCNVQIYHRVRSIVEAAGNKIYITNIQLFDINLLFKEVFYFSPDIMDFMQELAISDILKKMISSYRATLPGQKI